MTRADGQYARLSEAGGTPAITMREVVACLIIKHKARSDRRGGRHKRRWPTWQAGKVSQQSGAGDSEQELANAGSLLTDANRTPAHIRYPTDISLLNEAPEKSEEIIDGLHRPAIGRTVKPQAYRRNARKDYLRGSHEAKAGRLG